MNTRQMEFAVEVAKEKSFTVAAHNLKVTQPSLSQTILNLENELGVQIFDRKHNLALTYAGEIYISKAKVILNLQKNLKDEISELVCNKKTLKIAFSQIGYAFTYKDIINFCKRFPKINVKIVQLNSSIAIKRAILNSYIDFGIFTLPIETDEISYEIIKKEKTYLAVSLNHKLSKKFQNSNEKYPKIKLSSLKKEKFILPRDSQRTRGLIDKIFLKNNFKPKISCEVESFSIAIQMVISGLGICFINSQFITEDIKNSIKLFDIDEPDLDKTLVLAYKKDKKLSKIFFELLDIIKS
ncbi:transcriptional regulator, LysR family [Campylobacter blaseri]|uniref:Transcriptional regulator n=1 Tax=Campylobacter blaseri TaxID=2042961 RepID=A0A2P8R199_9BACT|nr:LysR family transcriptional regulator [Campylobacter blaseri]PSM52269.1 transcriptional regulator [Campylobacter blaseri]PSM54035.1 transcriptional regulator [Campylobacter blaseri]QKF85476.1 transcriptional regulator, LysR family [Campylobacter blaseri]